MKLRDVPPGTEFVFPNGGFGSFTKGAHHMKLKLHDELWIASDEGNHGRFAYVDLSTGDTWCFSDNVGDEEVATL